MLQVHSAFSYCVLLSCFDIFYFTLAHNGVGEPLFLTPYIELRMADLGRLAALVNPIMGVESYSGFLTVNQSCNSNLFFWYFPAEESPQDAPVVLWLQGGPGTSSMFGLFQENGPLYLERNGTAKIREHHWSKVFHMIYIDNPVGTGFSFTDNDECFAKDQHGLSLELFSAVQQFFEIFPYLRKNEFYISGESYAGKYIPALAYVIHGKNAKNISNINLKGIAIGNGFIDPENMMNYGDYFYQLGIIDANEKSIFKGRESEIIRNIQEQNYRKATDIFQTLILGGFIEGGTFFRNFTGFSFIYNLLHDKDYSPYGDMNVFLQSEMMRKALHVGNLTFHADLKVEEFLYDDIMVSAKQYLEDVIENNRVLLYSGQLDLVVPYPCTRSFLEAFHWTSADQFRKALRKKWFVGSNLAGYYRSGGGLTEVLVRNAGHMVPGDQPLWAFELITRFVIHKSF